MCIKALPKHLQTVEAWAGTDHDNWMFRWFIPLKLKYLCFGPRDTHKLHKWRDWPILLFALGSSDEWRFENDKSDRYSLGSQPRDNEYLSRIQYKKDWHIQVQWPLFLACHIKIGQKPLYFYIGAHRDADKVYWIPSVYIGLKWK